MSKSRIKHKINHLIETIKEDKDTIEDHETITRKDFLTFSKCYDNLIDKLDILKIELNL